MGVVACLRVGQTQSLANLFTFVFQPIERKDIDTTPLKEANLPLIFVLGNLPYSVHLQMLKSAIYVRGP